MSVRKCLLCQGADDDENFDYCRACGRTAVLPVAVRQPPADSRLADAIRRARGDIESEDVPGIIEALNRAYATAREQREHSSQRQVAGEGSRADPINTEGK